MTISELFTFNFLSLGFMILFDIGNWIFEIKTKRSGRPLAGGYRANGKLFFTF
jgi:hypothetical protein